MRNKRVCITGTIYSLFLYLLISSEQQIKDTFYFFGDPIPYHVQKNFKYYYSFKRGLKLWERRILKIYLRLFSRFKWNFLNEAEIYAQDHFWFSPGIIGNRDYTLLEDAPLIASRFYGTEIYTKQKTSNKKLSSFFYGPLFQKYMGISNQCTKIILTKPDNAPYLKGKELSLSSIDLLWDKCNEQKRKLILSIFNVTQTDIDLLKKKSKIFFSQPFFNDKFMSKEEHINLFKSVLADYDSQEVILKVHPRDLIEYENYFPKILIFKKPIPMQLFNLLGIKFTSAITFFSTAALSFPYDIEIDWRGTKVHKNLLNHFGDLKLSDYR